MIAEAALAMMMQVVTSGATTGSKFAWDMPAPDAVTAQAYTWKYYPDGSVTAQALTGVTCAGTSPIVCEVPIPAFTPGPHTIQITATNVAGEGTKGPTPPFAFTFVVTPGAASNMRIK